jgi:hypothetical protein
LRWQSRRGREIYGEVCEKKESQMRYEGEEEKMAKNCKRGRKGCGVGRSRRDGSINGRSGGGSVGSFVF